MTEINNHTGDIDPATVVTSPEFRSTIAMIDDAIKGIEDRPAYTAAHPESRHLAMHIPGSGWDETLDISRFTMHPSHQDPGYKYKVTHRETLAGPADSFSLSKRLVTRSYSLNPRTGEASKNIRSALKQGRRTTISPGKNVEATVIDLNSIQRTIHRFLEEGEIGDPPEPPVAKTSLIGILGRLVSSRLKSKNS